MASGAPIASLIDVAQTGKTTQLANDRRIGGVYGGAARR